MRRSIAFLSTAAVATTIGFGAMSAGATAAPAWYVCTATIKVHKQFSGEFTDKNCIKPEPEGHGKWKLTEGIGKGKAFKGRGKGQINGDSTTEVRFYPADEDEIECLLANDEGKPALPNKLVKVKLTFRHCQPFHTPGLPAGEIVSNVLSGELGNVKAVKTTVGVDLANEAEPGNGVIFELADARETFRVRGSVIAEVVNEASRASKLWYLRFSVGHFIGETEPGVEPLTNIPAFEGGPTDILEAERNTGSGFGAPEPSALEAELKNKGEALEAKS